MSSLPPLLSEASVSHDRLFPRSVHAKLNLFIFSAQGGVSVGPGKMLNGEPKTAELRNLRLSDIFSWATEDALMDGTTRCVGAHIL